jgi:hypothetical protein
MIPSTSRGIDTLTTGRMILSTSRGIEYLQLKTGGNLIYTVRNWVGGKLPSVSLNSSTELAVVAVNGRLFHSRMDLGKNEVR